MTAPDAPVELRELPAPDLEPGSALLEVERSEVCGTDVHLWHGLLVAALRVVEALIDPGA